MKSKQSRSRNQNVRIICKREKIRRTIHCSVLSTGCEKNTYSKTNKKNMFKPVGFVTRFRLFSSCIHTNECSFGRFPHKNQQFMCFFGETVFLFDFKRRNAKFISCRPNQGKKCDVQQLLYTITLNHGVCFGITKTPTTFTLFVSHRIFCAHGKIERKKRPCKTKYENSNMFPKAQ